MEFNLANTDPSYVAMYGLNHNIESLEGVLDISKGSTIMTEEEMKVALITSMLALKKQMQVNQTLIARIEKLETKKKFRLRFWK